MLEEQSLLTPSQGLRKGEWNLKKSSSGKTKRWWSLAVLLCPDFSFPALHRGTAPAAPENVSEKGSQKKKPLQAPLFLRN